MMIVLGSCTSDAHPYILYKSILECYHSNIDYTQIRSACAIHLLKMYKNEKNSKGKRCDNSVKLPPIENSNDSDKVKTVVDIDPHYYSLVKGRPIRPNHSLNTYKQNIRDVVLKRTINGFLNDEILRIDQEINKERDIFENAEELFYETKKSFDKFLAYDNDKTISIMKKSDSLNKELMNKTEYHKKISYEMASLKSKMQYIDETLLILLSFENFLMKVAPYFLENSENRSTPNTHTEIFTMDTNIFQKINTTAIKEKIDSLPIPKLIFGTPEQLLKIFNFLEKQNLNFLLKTEELNTVKINFFKARDLLLDDIKKEMIFIQEKVSILHNILVPLYLHKTI